MDKRKRGSGKRSSNKKAKFISKSSTKSMTKFILVFVFAIIILAVFALSINTNNYITGFTILEPIQKEPIQKGAWNLIQDENYIGGDALFTNTLNSSLEYEFNASSVQIVTQKREDFGIMNVKVDEETCKIDPYSEETKYNASYDFDLTGDEHKLVVSVGEEKNNLSTDYYFLVDEVFTFLNATEENNETLKEDTIPIITEDYLVILTQAEDLDYQGLWFKTENSAYSGNTSLISNYPGDFLEFEFSGNNIYLLTEKRDDFGVANVSIDDDSYLVDFYSQESIKPYLISVNELSDSDHSMKIEVTDMMNKDSNDKYVVIDGFLQSKIGDLSEYELFDINGIQIDEITDTLYEEVPEELSEAAEIVDTNATETTETIIAPEIIKINEPVKWTKTVTVDESIDNITIGLPKEVVNVSVKKKDEFGNEEIVDDEKIKVVDENKEIKEIAEFVKDKQIDEIEREINLKKEYNINTDDLEEKKDKIEKEKKKSSGNDELSVSGLGVNSLSVENEEEGEEAEPELIITEEITTEDELEVEYYTEAPIAVEQNVSINKKEILISSETHYENILAYTYLDDVPLSAIKIYRTTDGIREETELYSYADLNDNELIDYVEWIIPHLSNQSYEVSIEILNVQSYPMVGGNWTVMFTTSGVANLTIAASNGTTWDEFVETEDLKFLELTCNNESADYYFEDGSVFVEDYNCTGTGKEISKVLTSGKHTLMFEFGDQVAYAYNDAVGDAFYKNTTWAANLNAGTSPVMAMGDINNDDWLDMVVFASATGSEMTGNVYINNGTSFIDNLTWSQNFTNLSSPRIDLIDIDNNGWMDLFYTGEDCSGSCIGYVYIYTNNGSSFNKNYTWSGNITGKTGSYIAKGDFDLDGDIDFLMIGASDTQDGTGSKSAVYINNGTTFNEDHGWQKNLTNVYAGWSYGGLSIANINNDSYVDLFLSGFDEDQNNISEIYINNGTTFVYNATYSETLNEYGSYDSMGVSTFSIYSTFTDFNNDGAMDLAIEGVINGANQFDIYLNNNTHLVYNASWTTGISVFNVSRFYTADYNADGNIDIVRIPDGMNNEFNVTLYNNSGNNFDIDYTYAASLPARTSSMGILGDINNDSDPDFIVMGTNNSGNDYHAEIFVNKRTTRNNVPNVPTLFNDGYSGTFDINWSGASDTEAGSLYYNLRVGTTSGANDIVSGKYASSNKPTQGMFGNMMTGNFISLNVSNLTYFWAVQTIDSSLTVSAWSTEQVYNTTTNVVVGPAVVSDTFEKNTTWGDNLDGGSSSAIVMGDINNDDWLDLVVMQSTPGFNNGGNVYINNGTSFNNNITWAKNFTNISMGSLALGDVNNDGWLDLFHVATISGATSKSYFQIYINNGSSFVENYTWQQNLTVKEAVSIAIEDFDNDGDIDCIMIGSNSSMDGTGVHSKVYINNGTTFTENYGWQKNLTGVYQDGSSNLLSMGDIDNDTYVDLLLMGTDENGNVYVEIYINNGTTFVHNTTYSDALNAYAKTESMGGTFPIDSTFADFNNDGWLDLAIEGTVSGTDQLDIYINNGTNLQYNASWTSSITLPNATMLYPVDYNADGNVDLVNIPNTMSTLNFTFYNNSGNNFDLDLTYAELLPTDWASAAGIFGDFNNDSDPDFFITGSNNSGNDYHAEIYVNKRVTRNNVPTAPSSFNDGYSGTFDINWSGAPDTEGGAVYYNLRVGTTSAGNDIVSGKYGSSNSPTQGMFGNMMQNNFISLNVSNQDYYWAVQTIDSSLKASAWSTEQVFNSADVDSTAPSITIIVPTNFTNLSAGTEWTWVNITTNENATCEYNDTNDFTFETDGTNFTVSNNTNHNLNYSNNSIGLVNDSMHTFYYKCNDTSGNVMSSSVVHTFGVNASISDEDLTAPTILIIYPSNNSNLSAGTTWTWVNITTNENATCQYNDTNDFTFDSDGTNFTKMNNTYHYYNYSNNSIGLLNGTTYTLYYKCNDTSGNIMTLSTGHVFRLNKSDMAPPTVSIVYPSNNSNLSAGTEWTWVNITTNENATCQYNDTNDFTFETDGTNFTVSNNTNHYLNYSNNSIGLLNDSAYTLYYKCNDTSGNIMSISTGHVFRLNKSDMAPPTISIINPQNQSELSIGTKWAWVNITTNENATCQYNYTNDFTFETDGTNFTTLNNTYHYLNYSNNSVGLLNASSHTLYYKCNDTSGNINPSSTTHAFSVGEFIEISSCQDLDSINSKYKLTQDIEGDSSCINILETGITLDCNGYRIEGNGDINDNTYGINITEQIGINISNCTIFNFTQGIYLKGGNHSIFSNLNLTNNSGSGISISTSINNTIFLSTIKYNSNQGVNLDGAHNHTFYNNTFLNPTTGGSGSYTSINFQMTSGSNSEDTVIYLNSFTDSDCLGSTNNADRINLNNSNLGNFWTSKDEPSEACYDTNIDGICDDVYNFTALSAGGGGNDIIDYFPLRKSEITPGISISLDTASGAGQNNDSSANGYIVPNDVANYFVNIINNQNSSDNITLNTSNYGVVDSIVLNQSSFVDVPAYGKTSFAINISHSSLGSYIVGINATANDSDYNNWLNLSTKIIQAFKDDTIWETNLTGTITPAIASGDIDGDDDFDLIIIGEDDNGNAIANVYINNGSTFNVNYTWSQNITNVTSPSIALADINNNGLLDLIVSGSDVSSGASTEVYINNQTGLIQNLTWSQNITSKQSALIAIGDINLDGKVDMVLVGANNTDPTGVQSKVYINNGTILYENHAWQKNLTGMYNGAANLFDINNDTYLDLLITGKDENFNILTEIYISNQTTFVYNSSYSLGFGSYESPGEGNDLFTAPADYNNDGLIDIAMFGQVSGTKQLEIYFNNQTSYDYNSSWTSGLSMQVIGVLYPGDYDNNGNIDLISIPAGSTSDSALALNNTGINFSEDSEFEKFLPNNLGTGATGIDSGTGLLVDVDADNNLDLVLVADESGASAEVYTGELSSDNTAPSAPTTFSNSYGDSLNINWSGASDTEGGTLYYNLRVGTSSGENDIVSGKYGSASNPSQGMFGNMLTGTSVSLNVSNRIYYWSVQTIDTSLKASAWSNEQMYEDIGIEIDSCQILNTASEKYRLTQNILNGSGCFDIQADGITLDCQGYKLEGNGTSNIYAGINITGRTGVIVKNCSIFNFSYGVYLYGANLSGFSNLTVSNNTYDGIYMYSANNNSINSSSIEYNTNYGLYFDGSNDNEFYNNTVNGNTEGDIMFQESGNGKTNNTIFVWNTFMYDYNVFNSLQNTNNLMLNNSNFGNFWTDKDEPIQGCYDTDINGICDDIYNLSAEGANQDAGSNHVIDYLPLRKSSITAGINLSLIESTGVGQYGDNTYDGYATIGNIETYYVNLVNNQDSSDNVTLNLSNYNNFDTLISNQSVFVNIGAYSKVSFALNISDASVGIFLLGINATTNDSDYNNWLNISTKVIEAFKEQSNWEANISGGFSDAITSGDIDNDDNLDLVIIGGDGSGNSIANVYTNDGSTFNVDLTWSKNITNVTSPSSILVDIDNNGWLDLIVSGTNSDNGDNIALTKVYTNNLSSFVENNSWQQNITPKQSGSIAVGDINLDGKIDMVLIGVNASEGGVNGLESKVYINNGTQFLENHGWQKNLTGMYYGSANLFDFNNDTYLDLLIVGKDENDVIYTEIYINNQTTFVYNSSYSLGISQSYESPVESISVLYTAIGDYNNDALVDIAIQGKVSSTTQVDIYFNNQTSFNYNSSWTSGLTFNNPGMLYPGDYNNNAKIDLIYVPISTASDSVVILNNTGINFTEDTDFERFLPTNNNAATSIGSGSGLFADFDDDNNLDLVLIGDISGASAKIYTGELLSDNNAPSAPSSLTNNNQEDGLNLTWSGASDTQGGILYYNIKVGNSSGSNNIVSGKYGVGSSPAQGMYGNMMTSNRILLNVTNRTYYWSVQTIDSSLKASSWSSESNTDDDSAPTITIVNPTNNSYIGIGTAWQWINITTDENGNCQYNNSNDFTFNVNGTNFDTSGTTEHFFNLTGLTDGSTHNLYFRCNDTYGNENNVSTMLSFRIKNAISNCSNLSTSNMVYELNSSIENTEDAVCLNAYTDDITIDCQGYVIDGKDTTNTYGIYINGSDNVIIRNCTITDFYDGIFINKSTNSSLITNNNFTNNSRSGIYFGDNFSSYKNNNISSNIFNSQELSTGYDIYLIGLYNNISLNNFSSTNVMQNIYVKSNSNSNNNIIDSNRFSDSGNYTICIGNDSNNNIVSNNLIIGSYDFGIYLNGSDYNLIKDNNITSHGNTSFDSGIILNSGATYNNITNNTFKSNYEYAIFFNTSADNNSIVWKNNFINNQTGHYIYDNSSVNFYNLSSIGNYWDVYDDSDEGCVESNDDGICDSNFTVDNAGKVIDHHAYTSFNGWLLGRPTVTEYNTSIGSTNFSAVANTTSVPNLTLANTQGKIKWTNQLVNAKDQDFDTNIEIGDEFVVVNTSQLDSTLNTSADITITSVNCTGFKPLTDLIYTEQGYSTKDDIQANGKSCPTSICSSIVCTGGVLNFTVAHFTGYAFGGNANLTVYDDYEGSSVAAGTNSTFYANYTNSTGQLITSASCNITFNDNPGDWYQMTENGNINYNYSKSFVTSATYSWNVTCDADGYTELNANDTIVVVSGSSSISSCQTLSSSGTTYELTQDLQNDSTCFDITANNITLDCQGNKITGNGTTPKGNPTINADDLGEFFSGIRLQSVDNITILNCTITNFTDGIYINYSNFSTIINVNITNNTLIGIMLNNANTNFIKLSDFSLNSYYSVEIYMSHYTTIFNNTFDGIQSSESNAGNGNGPLADIDIGGNSGSGSSNHTSIYGNTFTNYTSLSRVCSNGRYTLLNDSTLGNRWLSYDEPMDFVNSEGYRNDAYYDTTGWADGCFDANDDGICDNIYNLTRIDDSDTGNCSTDGAAYGIDYHPIRKSNITNNISLVLSSGRGIAYYSTGTDDDDGIDGYIASGVQSITSSIGSNYTLYLVNNLNTQYNFTTACIYAGDGDGAGCALTPHFTGSTDDEGINAYSVREVVFQVNATQAGGDALGIYIHNIDLATSDSSYADEINVSSKIIQAFVDDPSWTATGGNYVDSDRDFTVGGSGTVMAAGDVNNDNKTDLIIMSGSAPTAVVDTDYLKSHVIINNGSAFVHDGWEDNLTSVSQGSIMLADINNDLYLDLIVAGSTHPNGNTGNATLIVYINNQTMFVENRTWSSNITILESPSITTGDIDLDGDIDLITIGDNFGSSNSPVSKVYVNNGSSFVESNSWQNNLTAKSDGSSFLLDINNDHYMDLVLSGADANSNSKTEIYINNGTTFMHNITWGAGLANIPVSTFNNIAFADLNNDNWMDTVVLGGWVFINNKTTLVKDASWSDNITGDITFLGDYDNDGYIDLLTDRIDYDGGNDPVTFYNNGSSLIRDNQSNKFISILNSESAIFADFNGNGNLDIFAAEEAINYNNRDDNDVLLFLNLNNASNTAPGDVTNFTAVYDGGIDVEWAGSTDPEGGPTYYNIRIGTTSGGYDVISPKFGYSADPTQGIYGNMQSVNSTLFNVPQETNTFYLGVQAVDTGLKKGNWTETTITYVPDVGVVQVGGAVTKAGEEYLSSGTATEDVINEILEHVDAEDLGLETLSRADVDVTVEDKISEEEDTTVESIEEVLKQDVNEVVSEELRLLQTAVERQTASSVRVKKSLTGYKIKSKETGKEVDITLIEAKIRAGEPLTGLTLVEAIPKSMAQHIREINFLKILPTKILQADPIVKFYFEKIERNEEKKIRYLINKKIDKLETTSIAVYENAIIIRANENRSIKLEKGEQKQIALGNETLNINVDELGNDSAVINIKGISYKIKIGESKDIDLDKDGKTDINIVLLSSKSGIVEINLRKIVHEGKIDERDTKDEKQIETAIDLLNKQSLYMVIGTVLLLVISYLFMNVIENKTDKEYLVKKKKEKKKKKKEKIKRIEEEIKSKKIRKKKGGSLGIIFSKLKKILLSLKGIHIKIRHKKRIRKHIVTEKKLKKQHKRITKRIEKHKIRKPKGSFKKAFEKHRKLIISIIVILLGILLIGSLIIFVYYFLDYSKLYNLAVNLKESIVRMAMQSEEKLYSPYYIYHIIVGLIALVIIILIINLFKFIIRLIKRILNVKKRRKEIKIKKKKKEEIIKRKQEKGKMLERLVLIRKRMKIKRERNKRIRQERKNRKRLERMRKIKDRRKIREEKKKRRRLEKEKRQEEKRKMRSMSKKERKRQEKILKKERIKKKRQELRDRKRQKKINQKHRKIQEKERKQREKDLGRIREERREERKRQTKEQEKKEKTIKQTIAAKRAEKRHEIRKRKEFFEKYGELIISIIIILVIVLLITTAIYYIDFSLFLRFITRLKTSIITTLYSTNYALQVIIGIAILAIILLIIYLVKAMPMLIKKEYKIIDKVKRIRKRQKEIRKRQREIRKRRREQRERRRKQKERERKQKIKERKKRKKRKILNKLKSIGQGIKERRREKRQRKRREKTIKKKEKERKRKQKIRRRNIKKRKRLEEKRRKSLGRKIKQGKEEKKELRKQRRKQRKIRHIRAERKAEKIKGKRKRDRFLKKYGELIIILILIALIIVVGYHVNYLELINIAIISLSSTNYVHHVLIGLIGLLILVFIISIIKVIFKLFRKDNNKNKNKSKIHKRGKKKKKKRE